MNKLITAVRNSGVAVAVLGDWEKVRTYRQATDALHEQYQRALRGETPMGETEEYHRLNDRVNALMPTVPFWRR